MPAWPIPIHHTKFTIAKPQPMGMLMPQIPTPLMISHDSETNSTMTTVKLTAKPTIHPVVGGRVKTTAAILSVTDA